MSNSVFHNIYTQRVQQAYNNVAEENYQAMSAIYTMYLSTVINTFKYKNLPKNILPFLPEQSLAYWGLLGAFKDGDTFKMFPAYPTGQLLENGEYSDYAMISRNGKTWNRKREEIALCYNNSLAVPSVILIREFAEKSATALRAVDSALERSMIPAILECETEDQFKKLSDLYDRAKNQLPFRLTFGEGLMNNGVKVSDIFDAKKYDMLMMWDVYVRYRNLFYTSFGINNVEIQKRERLTEAEGSGNDEITRYTMLTDMYERRLEFRDEVKEKFGVEYEVEINRDSATVYNVQLTNDEKIDDIQLNIMRGINVQSTEDDQTNDDNVNKNDEEKGGASDE